MTRTTTKILQDLVKMAEDRARKTPPSAKLNRARYPGLFDLDDAGERTDTLDDLQRLEREGVLQVRWVSRREVGNRPKDVVFAESGLPAAYRLLGRTPRARLLDDLRQQLEALAATTPGLVAYQQMALDAVTRDVGLHALGLDSDKPRENTDVLACLEAIACLTRPTLTRTFSARVLGDSKRLDAIKGRVSKALKAVSPAAALATGNADDVLRVHHLTRYPERIQVYGPLQLEHAGRTLDVAPWPEAIGVSASVIQDSIVRADSARAVVTVENPASLDALVAERPRDIVLIYTEGSPSPAVVGLIERLAASLPVRHWGDIDVGGFKILAHIRKTVPTAQGILMDAETLRAYAGQRLPLTKEDVTNLRGVREEPALERYRAALDELRNGKLEQEHIPARQVLAKLP